MNKKQIHTRVYVYIERTAKSISIYIVIKGWSTSHLYITHVHIYMHIDNFLKREIYSDSTLILVTGVRNGRPIGPQVNNFLSQASILVRFIYVHSTRLGITLSPNPNDPNLAFWAGFSEPHAA